MTELLIKNARLWAANNGQVAEPADVLVRNGLVAAVGFAPTGTEPGSAGSSAERTSSASTKTQVVDVGGRVLTPGWWNCHVHLTEPVWAGAAKRNAAELQRELDDMFLSRGFCTVLDLASNSADTCEVIKRIETGELRGPRIITAAEPLHPPLGVPYYTRREVPWYLWWALPAPITARGAQRIVEKHRKRGARLTKLFTGAYVKPDRIKVMPARTATAAAQASHQRGMLVFAHPSNAKGVERALDADVDVLAHLPDTAEGTHDLLVRAARSGVSLVPTLHMFATTVSTNPAYLDPIDEALRTFRGAGGRVLFGTDVGYMADRSTGGEFLAMARCGMSASDILASLTAAPAELLDDRGSAATFDVGAPADFTVLATDASVPTPEHLADVHCVIRAGELIYQSDSDKRG